MRYLKGISRKFLYKEPIDFNKESSKEILKYSIGANLYMNGGIDFYNKIIKNELNGLGSISICFEDATKESLVKEYEDNVIYSLEKLDKYFTNNRDEKSKIPLIFFRVRNYSQFVDFSKRISKNHYKYIAGFIFPKFNSSNGAAYLKHLKLLNEKYNEKLYSMPILESEELIYKESRISELLAVRDIFNEYRDYILNIRVGGTDFSSKFGLRRSVNSNIYNVKVVSDCLIDIINFFLREKENYVISAPVWEYFSENSNSKEVSGLIDEIKLDKENGFYGKTIIHPSQIKYVNSMYAVTYEEYVDAINIIKESDEGGVFKGYGGNKMNEVKPHFNWSMKIMARAQIFGVLNAGISNEDLFNCEKKFKGVTI